MKIVSLFFALFLSIAPIFGAPTVTSVSPTFLNNSRTANSNPAITITGTDFSTATFVNFGSLALGLGSFTVDSDTQITVDAGVLPAAVPGTVDVTVTATSGTSPTNQPYDYFTYRDQWLAYVPDFNGNNQGFVYVFSADLMTQISTITGTPAQISGSEEVVITPDGAFAYCVNYGSNTMAIIDCALNTSGTTFFYDLPNIEANPIGVANSPGNGDMILITDYGSSNVTQLDITNRQSPTVTREIAVGTNPTSVAFLPDPLAHQAFVTNFGQTPAGTISIIDTTNGSTTTHTDIHLMNPSWIAAIPVVENAPDYDLVVLDDNQSVAIFYSLSGTTLTPVHVLTGFALNDFPFFPQVLPNPSSTKAYVTNSQTGDILSHRFNDINSSYLARICSYATTRKWNFLNTR